MTALLLLENDSISPRAALFAGNGLRRVPWRVSDSDIRQLRRRRLRHYAVIGEPQCRTSILQQHQEKGLTAPPITPQPCAQVYADRLPATIISASPALTMAAANIAGRCFSTASGGVFLRHGQSQRCAKRAGAHTQVAVWVDDLNAIHIAIYDDQGKLTQRKRTGDCRASQTVLLW